MLSEPPIALTSFTARSNGGHLSRLLTSCTISEAWDTNSPTTSPVAQTFQALWDTGASRSAIDCHVTQALGLINTTFTDVETAGGRTLDVPVYLVNIVLPNNVQVVGVEAAGLQLPTGVDALIGMDIINAGDFAVTNQGGKTTFSFRMPSKVEIDFVSEDNIANLLRKQPSPSKSKRQQSKQKRNRRK